MFSFAMTVRLPISVLLLAWRSLSESAKSSAISAEEAPESELRGDLADMQTASRDKKKTRHENSDV